MTEAALMPVRIPMNRHIGRHQPSRGCRRAQHSLELEIRLRKFESCPRRPNSHLEWCSLGHFLLPSPESRFYRSWHSPWTGFSGATQEGGKVLIENWCREYSTIPPHRGLGRRRSASSRAANCPPSDQPLAVVARKPPEGTRPPEEGPDRELPRMFESPERTCIGWEGE